MVSVIATYRGTRSTFFFLAIGGRYIDMSSPMTMIFVVFLSQSSFDLLLRDFG